jgi:hypothetical protein
MNGEAQSAQKVNGIYQVLSRKVEYNEIPQLIVYLQGAIYISRPESEQRNFMPSVHSRLGDHGSV